MIKFHYAEFCDCKELDRVFTPIYETKEMTAARMFVRLRNLAATTHGPKQRYFAVHLNNKHILNITNNE